MATVNQDDGKAVAVATCPVVHGSLATPTADSHFLRDWKVPHRTYMPFISTKTTYALGVGSIRMNMGRIRLGVRYYRDLIIAEVKKVSY